MVDGEEKESGVRRWLVDITRWHPSPAQIDAATSLLPPHEAPAIARFVREDDRKRALVSRLLQYSLARQVLGVPFHRITVRRTAQGKPYLLPPPYNGREDSAAALFPNFNFSASHQGDYVGIASEPLCLVGLDIVDVSKKPQGETVPEFIRHFSSSCFTHHEWSCIVRAGDPDQVLTEFYKYWCLKEAYVKAIGAGVGFGLRRLEFRHVHWTDISVRVDGRVSRRWSFCISMLDATHLACIAKGPPEDAVDGYKETLLLLLPDLIVDEEQLRAAREVPEQGFVLRSVEQLTRLLQD